MIKIKKNKGFEVSLFIFIAGICFIGGLIVGMVIQQITIINAVGKVLSYSDIDIDVNINETKFVQELNNTLGLTIREIVNQTGKNSNGTR